MRHLDSGTNFFISSSTSFWYQLVIWRRNRFQGTGSKIPEPVPKPVPREPFHEYRVVNALYNLGIIRVFIC